MVVGQFEMRTTAPGVADNVWTIAEIVRLINLTGRNTKALRGQVKWRSLRLNSAISEVSMKRCIIVGIVVLMMLAVVACDQGSSLQDVIARAITKTSEASSYRSAGNSTAHTDSVTDVFSHESEYAAPDRYHSLETYIAGDAGNVTTTTRETIVFGDKAYLQSLDEPHQWHVCEVYTSYMWPEREPKPGTTCFLAVNTLERDLERFNYLVKLEKLPDEEIGGVNCSHYRGSVDYDAWLDMRIKRCPECYEGIPPESLEQMRQQELSTEFWIDGDDYIRQHRTEGRFRNSDEKWITGFGVTRYFDFNEPIYIEPPEIEGQ